MYYLGYTRAQIPDTSQPGPPPHTPLPPPLYPIEFFSFMNEILFLFLILQKLLGLEKWEN